MMWKTIPALSGRYEASENGDIRNTITKQIRKPRKGKFGYLQLNISRNDGTGKSTTMSVHRLVASAFLANENNLPEVNHIDGNKLNNNVNNLEWCTYSENGKHAYKHGLQVSKKGEEHPNAKLTSKQVEEIRYRRTHEKISQQELADMFGVSQGHIGRIIRCERYANS